MTSDDLQASLDEEGLPDLKQWRASDPQVSTATVLHASTTGELAVLHTALFWPDLVRHEGGLFLADRFDPQAYDSWRSSGTDLSATERVMNHVHLGEAFRGDFVGLHHLRHLGSVLRQCWTARLRAVDPDAPWVVDLSVDEPNEEVVVTFWCDRPAAAAPVTYTRGREHAPDSPFGLETLNIQGGEVTYERRQFGDTSKAAARLGSDDFLDEALGLAAFPAVPQHMIPPGSGLVTLSRGDDRAVMDYFAARKFDGYGPLVRRFETWLIFFRKHLKGEDVSPPEGLSLL